jgi:hypothetical protein
MVRKAIERHITPRMLNTLRVAEESEREIIQRLASSTGDSTKIE